MHLGERECSIQRRHQKLIEEAPVAGDDAGAARGDGRGGGRRRRGDRLRSSGTIEFLLDEDGSFYFMEMNTRIQVEHPVTEMVTGVDLVQEQIRVAAGEPLRVAASGRQLRGHAIECRDQRRGPARNFAPSPGKITAFHPPGGPGRARRHARLRRATCVPPYYDSLLAKLIVPRRDTRQEAIARMRRRAREFIVEGVAHDDPVPARADAEPGLHGGRHRHEVPGAETDGGASRGRDVKIDVCFTPAEVVAERPGNGSWSSSMCCARRARSPRRSPMARGGRSAPRSTTRSDRAGGRPRTTPCSRGERRSLPIEGFDLGNSPRRDDARAGRGSIAHHDHDERDGGAARRGRWAAHAGRVPS